MKRVKNIKKNKKQLIIVLVICVFAVVSTYIFFVGISPKVSNDSGVYKPKGTNGKPATMISYYNDAIKEFKAGNKDKAKDYAQKVLDENDRMTTKNQSTVENQPEMVENAFDILEGKKPDDI